jgi:thioredoxin reductase (NADPH)
MLDMPFIMFPGIKNINGMMLANNLREQVEQAGTELRQEKVEELRKQENCFVAVTAQNEYECRNVLFATGTVKRKLGIEEKFQQIHYDLLNNAKNYKDKAVAVSGSGEEAANAAAYLSRYTKRVVLVCKNIEADEITLENLRKNRVEIVKDAKISELIGANSLEKIRLDSGKGLEVSTVFVEEGGVPNVELVKDLVKLDSGSIAIDESFRTNVKGIFAAGDVCNSSCHNSLLLASAQGMLAAKSITRKSQPD